jgi:hypothetical protein
VPTRLRRFFPAVLASLGAALVGASFAWACTPQAEIALDPSAGPVGSAVTVRGYTFAGNERVEILWDDPPQVLRTTTAGPEEAGEYTWPSFSERVTIPRAAEGVHTIVAEVSDEGRTYRPAATFTIRSDRPASPRPAPEPAGGRAQRPRGNQTPRRQRGAGTPATRSAGRAERPASVAAGSTSAGAMKHRGRQVFAGSVGPPGVGVGTAPGPPVTRPGASPQGAAAAPHAAGAPSEQSATGDLWSGFGAGRPASLTASATDPEVPAHGPGWQLPVGLGLLGFGLLALFVSLAVADTRRRRALR